MGKIENNILGICTGRFGNFVVYKRCGKVCVRTVTESRKSIGEKQVAQQERLAAAVILYKAARAAGLNEYWNRMEKPLGCSGYNWFIKQNLPAFTGDGRIGDFGKIALTAGRLQLPDNIRLQHGEGEDEVVLTWENVTLSPVSRANDRMRVAVMERDDRFNIRVLPLCEARREEACLVFSLPEKWKACRHIFCYMQSENGEEVSESRYAGYLNYLNY